MTRIRIKKSQREDKRWESSWGGNDPRKEREDARKGSELAALLLLPVCRYEWSVWGQMSLQAAVGHTQREDEWGLSFFLWPLRGPACPPTHTLFIVEEEEAIVMGGLDHPFCPIAIGPRVSCNNFSHSPSCAPHSHLMFPLSLALSVSLLPLASLILSHMIICSDS